MCYDVATETTRKTQHNSFRRYRIKMLYVPKASPLVSRVNPPPPINCLFKFLFFMADSVVVVDSRCWVLVARATVAMALRPHQGNCCYPPAPFPPPSSL